MTDIVSDDIKQLKGLDGQKKTLLAAFLFLLFLISILVSSNMSKKANKETAPAPQNGATTAPQPKTRLTLSPSTGDLKVGAIKTVSVELLEYPVTAADIVIIFDPEIFFVSNVQNGRVFDRVLAKKVEKGAVVFSGAVAPEKAFAPQKGVMFTFTVKALKESGVASLEFDTQKTITALNGNNTLGLSTGATFSIR